MAKHQLTHRKLQNDSGQQSGMYLFCDGMMVFSPLKPETVREITKKAVATGVNKMCTRFEEMLSKAAETTMVPTASEGTHGAGSGKTT